MDFKPDVTASQRTHIVSTILRSRDFTLVTAPSDTAFILELSAMRGEAALSVADQLAQSPFVRFAEPDFVMIARRHERSFVELMINSGSRDAMVVSDGVSPGVASSGITIVGAPVGNGLAETPLDTNGTLLAHAWRQAQSAEWAGSIRSVRAMAALDGDGRMGTTSITMRHAARIASTSDAGTIITPVIGFHSIAWADAFREDQQPDVKWNPMEFMEFCVEYANGTPAADLDESGRVDAEDVAVAIDRLTRR